MTAHESVLAGEVVEWLGLVPGKTAVDGTLGLGGHAERMLERLGPEGRLVGFDKDPESLKEARKRLARFGDRAVIIHDDFKNMGVHLGRLNISKVAAILLDLGVSSPQLDVAERGFSFQNSGPLDMRMNSEQSLTARQIINTYPKNELEKILFDLGEERYSRRIVSKIDETRSRRPIETTAELEQIIFHSVPRQYRYGRIHPATRTFQALRMAVNGELESLEALLAEAADWLETDGRMAVISSYERFCVNWFSFIRWKIGWLNGRSGRTKIKN